MAGAPQFKVYTPDNGYRAACKFPEDAAALVALYGDGATIRHGHAKRDTLYTQGADGDAGESYDAVARLVWKRLEDMQVTSYAKFYGITEQEARTKLAK